MSNINTLLQQNRVQVSHLLRRYRVMGDPTMETINRAHELHGAPFMTKLMGILTPTSNFTNFADMLNPGSFIDTAVKSQQQAPAKAKFWSFWDNLLNRVEKTGETVKQFKTDANGHPVQPIQTAGTVNPKTIYLVAGIIIVLIVAIFIIKKKA